MNPGDDGGRNIRKRLSRPRRRILDPSEIKMQRSRPKALLLAQIFLLFVIMIYFSKICILSMGLESGAGSARYHKAVFIYEMIMMIIALDALIGLSSKRMKSWRKVVRSSIILLLMTLLTSSADPSNVAAYVTFRPWLVIVVVIPVITLMFTKTVRRYYMPMMAEDRPIIAWIRFLLWTPVYDYTSYRISYDDQD